MIDWLEVHAMIDQCDPSDGDDTSHEMRQVWKGIPSLEAVL